ncbi:hypothetical protein [Paraburkholderia dipogonis]|uniref:hypothetical protein n=1 Tax=Paraburkholderia dipogonis TaxID=1211383 RepID=UPI0038BC746D
MNELQIIHAQACAAVAKADRNATPDVDAFWPLYLQAALDALRARTVPFGYAYLYPAGGGPVWRTNTNGREINGCRPVVARALFTIPPAPADWPQATRDVLDERLRQVEQEGWTHDHDDEHAAGTLALAAAAYALDAGSALDLFEAADAVNRHEPIFWPFSSSWWKPSTPRRSLVKAAALMLAEIERMDRDSSNGEDQ